MRPILCVGSAVLDHIFGLAALPGAPGKHFADSYGEAGGGPAANAAVTIVRLGGRARLWARVGDDGAGGRILAGLRAEGVEVGDIRPGAGAVSGISAVLIDRSGERLIVNRSDPALGSAPWPLPLETVAGMAAVLGDLRWPEATAASFARARQDGIPTILDGDAGTAGPIDAVLAATDIGIFSEQGLAEFSPDDGTAAALATLHHRHGMVAAVTRGADGVDWQDRTGRHHLPAPSIRAVDTLAAGDVFHGAFALAHADGKTLAAAMAFAAAAAALKCTRFGGRAAIPTAAELETFMRETGIEETG